MSRAESEQYKMVILLDFLYVPLQLYSSRIDEKNGNKIRNNVKFSIALLFSFSAEEEIP